jgi:hypothetical protein
MKYGELSQKLIPLFFQLADDILQALITDTLLCERDVALGGVIDVTDGTAFQIKL